MPTVRDLKVWIVADGEDVEEFGTEVVDETTTTCYIPSTLGQVSRRFVFLVRRAKTHLIALFVRLLPRSSRLRSRTTTTTKYTIWFTWTGSVCMDRLLSQGM